MNFDKANHWLVLFANFAVIASIVFLAVELRQNTKQLELQSYQSWVAANMDLNIAISNSQLSAIVSQGHPNSANLASETYIAYAMFHMSMFQMAQSTHYLHLEGSLNKELWESEMDRAAGILSIPGVRQWWDAGGKTQLTPSFVEFLESRKPAVTIWHWDEDSGYTSLGGFAEPEKLTE
ncbi:MAG TPA: hypothetical protein VLA11_03340 [Woeseiaceae bacterium]|nr:hypothetical protein [Woeseiaceae bacterium]